MNPKTSKLHIKTNSNTNEETSSKIKIKLAEDFKYTGSTSKSLTSPKSPDHSSESSINLDNPENNTSEIIIFRIDTETQITYRKPRAKSKKFLKSSSVKSIGITRRGVTARHNTTTPDKKRHTKIPSLEKAPPIPAREQPENNKSFSTDTNSTEDDEVVILDPLSKSGPVGTHSIDSSRPPPTGLYSLPENRSIHSPESMLRKKKDKMKSVKKTRTI